MADGGDEVITVDFRLLAEEIVCTSFNKHLLANQNPSLIIVAAHSSGAFVANEFFQQLYDHGADSTGKTHKKIIYYDLDGAGGVSGLTRSLLAHEYFVYARSGSLYSMNAGGIRSLGSGSNLIEIDASDSGCRSSRCLHDVVIIRHPWSSTTFDLSRDYGQYAVGIHEVQYDYITQKLAALGALINPSIIG